MLKRKEEHVWKNLFFTIVVKVQVAQVQAEAFAKTVDNNIVHEVTIDLTNIGVIEKTLEVSKEASTNEVVP